eukprot:29786-Pelagococcus_subviridis.AAC.3
MALSRSSFDRTSPPYPSPSSPSPSPAPDEPERAQVVSALRRGAARGPIRPHEREPRRGRDARETAGEPPEYRRARLFEPVREVHPGERRGDGDHGHRERRDRRLEVQTHRPVSNAVEVELPNLPRALHRLRDLRELAARGAYPPQVRLEEAHDSGAAARVGRARVRLRGGGVRVAKTRVRRGVPVRVRVRRGVGVVLCERTSGWS